ncbi:MULTISPECIES: sulfurtransferase [Halomonas]|uniref:sulfurtransferase n=1 Tax=Halomonas TaxID=2745 RepID=UPI001C946277|nr:MULTISPECIES: rhodanese-like domain-containing protein [Halomonas]MBY5968341.1 sulfurtransferase [Halomonas denitrificans]MBY5984285.1 sulfurtransferase [Halomonas sp. DP5Y7-2]MBY6028140.1 sulfurtransferase [Halomonas sp. DP8Y7-1]MED5297201.1 rhodanese-like domain-containing protein [Pseudomonadota bacterium]
MSSEDNLLPLIAEPEDLAGVLDHEDILVIDVPLKADSYAQGHVPGAIFLDHRRLLKGSGDVPNDVPDVEALSALFSSLGLTRDTHVVAYDDEGGGWAGRLLWTLELIGHRRYSYLNGGIHAWRAEGLPQSTEEHAATASDYQAEILNPEVAIDRLELQERLGSDHFAIWDARSVGEFEGTKGDNKRRGHLPGAVNMEWTDAMDRERSLRLRDYAELITELDAMGITPDMEVVTHCQSHHRSGFTWLVAKALGFERIRAYPGSWKEWGNRDDTPIEG